MGPAKISNVMTSYVVMVTPKMAKEWLNNNTENRPIRKTHVRMLSEAIQRGEWVLTPDGVAFDTAGRLVNAQHRLHAIIASGCAVPMNVTRNVPVEAFKVLDQGVKRTTSDLLGLDTRIAQPLRKGAAIAISSGTPTASQIEAVGQSGLLDTLGRIIAHCGTQARYFSSATMTLAAATSIMSGNSEEFVLRQYAALVLMRFDDMTEHSKALTRQVARTVRGGTDGKAHDLARGLRVFDPRRANSSRVVVDDADIANAPVIVRAVIRGKMEEKGIRLVVGSGRDVAKSA